MLHYTIQMKEEAIRLFFEDRKTYREIAVQLKIRKEERIKVWVKQYRREGIEAFTHTIGRPRKETDEKAYVARLEMENKLLKNFSPNCERICSRSAISDNLSLQRRIPSD